MFLDLRHLYPFQWFTFSCVVPAHFERRERERERERDTKYENKVICYIQANSIVVIPCTSYNFWFASCASESAHCSSPSAASLTGNIWREFGDKYYSEDLTSWWKWGCAHLVSDMAFSINWFRRRWDYCWGPAEAEMFS